MFELLGFLFMVGAVLVLGPMVFQFVLGVVIAIVALVAVGVKKVLEG